MSGWIACSERLPDFEVDGREGRGCLVYGPGLYEERGYLLARLGRPSRGGPPRWRGPDVESWGVDQGVVTHWQPLPSPPPTEGRS